jgi:hypothetical protein
VVAQSRPGGAQEAPRWTSTFAEPVSYKYLVARTITTTPDQSAIALPKNEPRWVPGPEALYRPIHSRRIPAETRLNECRRMKRCGELVRLRGLAIPKLLSLGGERRGPHPIGPSRRSRRKGDPRSDLTSARSLRGCFIWTGV